MYGEKSFEDRYEQALADTSLDCRTLRNYAGLRKFTLSRQRDSVNFGHHIEVATPAAAVSAVFDKLNLVACAGLVPVLRLA